MTYIEECELDLRTALRLLGVTDEAVGSICLRESKGRFKIVGLPRLCSVGEER